MTKIILFITIGLLLVFNLACQSETTSSNANANSAEAASNSNSKSLPPGFSTAPIAPSGNATPGIPDPNAANTQPAGAKNKPVSSDPTLSGKPLKKGATPIPGIPDSVISNQSKGTAANANQANPAGADANATTSGEGRPRTARKP
jgi:hypothetical protein